jgi:chromosome partitioning protein
MARAESANSADEVQRQPRAASFAFLKGGATKTTLSINTARHLAERNGEGSTLFIDFDPNGHATRNMNLGDDNLYHSGTDFDKVLLGAEPTVDPEDLAISTPFKFDLIPASNEHESLKKDLESAMSGSTRLRNRVVEELLGSEYEYIIIDLPSDPGMMNNNGVYASRNLLIPVLPKAETMKSFQRTRERLVTPLNERDIPVQILGVVPNLLGDRIDQQTVDREVLEDINTNDTLAPAIPNFARITEEEWEAIDAGEMIPPKPGIRESASITRAMKDKGIPLLDHKPNDPQTSHFDELAEIVEQGGVVR